MKYGPILPFISLILMTTIVASTPGQGSINVTGAVYDPNSAPIPGARITLYCVDRILQTTSDSSGQFQFNAVPVEKYEFEVVAPGFKRTTKQVDFVDIRRTPEKPMDLKIAMEIGEFGSPREIITATDVAPTGSCGPPDAVTYGPRKTPEADS